MRVYTGAHMLVIRLQRTGRENLPTYRIIVAEKARAAKGKFMEIVGHYLPAQTSPIFKFDEERIAHWIGKGATPSDTLARLLRKNGMKNLDRFIPRYTKQKSKSATEEAPAAAPAAAPSAPVEPPAAAAEATPA